MILVLALAKTKNVFSFLACIAFVIFLKFLAFLKGGRDTPPPQFPSLFLFLTIPYPFRRLLRRLEALATQSKYECERVKEFESGVQGWRSGNGMPLLTLSPEFTSRKRCHVRGLVRISPKVRTVFQISLRRLIGLSALNVSTPGSGLTLTFSCYP